MAFALRGHPRSVSDLNYSPDGRSIAASCWNVTVGLWDAASGRRVHSLLIRGLLVWVVAFTPDGRRLVAVDNIGRMTFWDTETGHEVLTFRGHPDRMYDLAFDVEGRYLVSASRDGSAKVWNATFLPLASGGPR